MENLEIYDKDQLISNKLTKHFRCCLNERGSKVTILNKLFLKKMVRN